MIFEDFEVGINKSDTFVSWKHFIKMVSQSDPLEKVFLYTI